MPRFFRLSPSGDSWLAQGDGPGHPLVLNGVEFARGGIQPNFQDESTAIYADTKHPALHVVSLLGGQPSVMNLPYTINALDARNGRWAAWAAPPAAPNGLVRTSDGREFVGYGAPALCDNGDLFIVRDGVIFLVAVGQTAANEVGGGGIGRLPRVAHGSTFVAWIEDPVNGPPVVAPASRGRYGQAHYVLPVMTPEGEWLVVVDADPDRMIAYPVGDPQGYVVATGVTKEPDAVWCASRGGIRIVASGANGELREFVVRLKDPRVDVRVAPPPPPVADPKITIAGEYPVSGTSPFALTVRVVAELGAGPIGRVVVSASSLLTSISQDRQGPGEVTLRLVGVGEYRIRAESWSPDGARTWRTSDHRRVTVQEPLPPPPPPPPPPGPLPDWNTITRESTTLLPAGTSLEYAVAWGILRSRGEPPLYPAPLAPEAAWRFLWPDRPFPGGSGGGGEPAPLPANPRVWRGNFLAFPGYPMAFMFPGWAPERRAAFVRAYRAAGHTHLPIGIWGAYPGHGIFDFRHDPGGYVGILQELRRAGIEPCVFVHTDAIPGRPPFSRAELTAWARGYLPHIRHLVRLWCSGWEFNQIDRQWAGYWCGNGTEHLAWGRDLRAMLAPLAPTEALYCHFSPERITGWPHYPHHDGPQDEPGWWKDSPFDGLLYQRRPDEDERWVLAHMIGGVTQDGSTDVGDATRIAGGAWGVNKDFVAFEDSRTLPRWQRLTNALKGHRLVSGRG